MSSDPSYGDPPGPPSADVSAPARPRRSRVRIAVGILAGMAFVVVALWAAAWFLAGAGVAPGTRVLGVDIGGLSRPAAAARLHEVLGKRERAPLPATASGRTISLDPVAAGLRLDAEATVARTGGRDWRPDRLYDALFASKAVDPVVTVDAARLDSALAQVASGVEHEPRDGGVSFAGGRAVAVAPVPGIHIERPGAGAALRAAYLRTAGPVVLPVTTVTSKVSRAEVERAMREFAVPALRAPVAVRAGATSVSLPPATLASALTMSADTSGHLVPALDGATLVAAIAKVAPAFHQPARNASLTVVEGRPRIVPGQPGHDLDPAALSRAVLTVLPRATGRSVTVALRTTAPTVGTEAVAGLGVKQVVASFTQPFPYAEYRVHNIGRAARYIDGTLLKPGQTFSMNGTVKERTEANGYTIGTVISNGRFREELGGGVSTITTAMWTAAFYAGLERVEQRAHSFYISRYKAGLEATVAYGSLDLKFRNNTPYGVLITAETGNDHVTIRIWSTKIWDRIQAVPGPRRNIVGYQTIYDTKPGCVEQPGQEGFRIDMTRVYIRAGKRAKSETFTTSYNPAAEIHCSAPPPSDNPARPPSPTPPPAD